MKKPDGFVYYPEKILAQTEHLDGEEFGIFWRMCSRIWLFTESQYSFEDTESNWRELSGIESCDRIGELKKKFLNSMHPLFIRSQNQRGVWLVQKWLQGSMRKIREKSRQNSQNARKRCYVRKCKDANAHENDMRTHVFRNATVTVPVLKDSVCLNDTDSTNKKDLTSKEEKDLRGREAEGKIEGISKKLGRYLSVEQVERVLNVCEITEEYVDEKIAIVKERKPGNEAAFLYAALTQNYIPAGEQVGRKKVGCETHRLVREARGHPLDVEEFEELPGNLREKFREVEHIVPERVVYKLIDKPAECGNAIERAIFGNLEMGETIEGREFNRLRGEHRKYFESVNRPVGRIKKFHLR